jgi:hypothetical protein
MLKQISFEDLSNIHVEMFLSPGDDERGNTLIAKFDGDYGIGCKGNLDAKFMQGAICRAVLSWEIDSIVLDMSNLSYEWGDMMVNVLLAADVHEENRDSKLVSEIFGDAAVSRSCPTKIVVSVKCKHALTSLLKNEMHERPEDWLFDDVATALQAAKRAVS